MFCLKKEERYYIIGDYSLSLAQAAINQINFSFSIILCLTWEGTNTNHQLFFLPTTGLLTIQISLSFYHLMLTNKPEECIKT